VIAALRAAREASPLRRPPGLLYEEYDIRERQLRGNLPQPFVHALLLDTAVRLGEAGAAAAAGPAHPSARPPPRPPGSRSDGAEPPNVLLH
jgi:hypothetical protein